jgi:hypothetical protein
MKDSYERGNSEIHKCVLLKDRTQLRGSEKPLEDINSPVIFKHALPRKSINVIVHIRIQNQSLTGF